MYNISQLEKKQIGLRLQKYLIDEIDELTEMFSVNRTDIIVEAIKSYVSEQRAALLYANFDKACEETKLILNGKLSETTLGDLIDEYKADSNS